MSPAVTRSLLIIYAILSMWLTNAAQDVTREIAAGPGSMVQITNKYGRVAAKAEAGVGDKPVVSRLTASSPKGVSESEIRIANAAGVTTITVTASDPKKRIDLVLTLPERTNLKVETVAGAAEVGGNFASVNARSDTGTISADVPADDVTYLFQWTESRPRVLADFELGPTKERNAGRFEIRGRHHEETEAKSQKREDPILGPPIPANTPAAKAEVEISKAVLLNFTTARGIILLNVPPNEVMSDLRERPLTEAAKAIVRSGDSLLMEAIRRASPKYFGDYARTLPPLRMEPAFSPRSSQMDVPNAATKTALVRVTDLQNRSISGLDVKDFEVTENSSPREIVSVTRSLAPFNLVLLLDVSGSVENYVNFIRKAARNFVNTVGKSDRVSIVIFNEDVKVLSKFTTDKGKLSESLDTFDAGGGTAYYDALAYAVSDTLRPLKGERSAIVVLTDGDDNRSFLAFDSLAGSIQESGALIYPLYVPSGLIALAASGADIDPLRKKYMSLTAKSEGEGEKLAKISGGVYYPITQIGQIQQAYEDIVVQMRSAYEITYRSTVEANGTGGASPKLKIRAKRENVFTAISSVTVAGTEE
jgi:VWFA-related protein